MKKTDYTIPQIVLLALNRLYIKISPINQSKIELNINVNKASDEIYKLLVSSEPCMITRFGAVEIAALTNYMGVSGKIKKKALSFIKGEAPQWWWNEGIRYAMTNNAGFFPATDENLTKFGELMLECIKDIDILGSWQPEVLPKVWTALGKR